MGPSLLDNGPQLLQLVLSRFSELGGHAGFELIHQLAYCGHDAVFWGYTWVGDVRVLVENGCGDYCRSCVLHPHCLCTVMFKRCSKEVAFYAML